MDSLRSNDLRSSATFRRKATLALLGIGLLVSVPTANAVVVYGYLEGVITSSNLYSYGTDVRVNFTYDTENPFDITIPCFPTYCEYPPDAVTLTIGSDIRRFGSEIRYGRGLLVQDDGAKDVLGVYHIDFLGFDTYNNYQAVHADALNVGDFLTGLEVPTRLRLHRTRIGEGQWTDSYYSNPSRYDYAYFSLQSLVLMDPAEALARLQEAASNVGPGSALADAVAMARSYYYAGDCPAMTEALEEFISKVESLLVSKKPRGATQALVDDAVEILKAYSCPVG